ncbi:MAG TPA: hypothetical protein D7I09_07700 [Candidatus Poseidoniales archaeon]|nr:MAG TPA: hypothetical protein D7I09_07700 [Candidatus Poseidoniales archaeon]HII19196.1 archease [Candidatus Poseidoniaceae archaeon]
MSHWIWPTTADLGLRAMAPNVERLFADAGLGLLAAMDVQGTTSSKVQHGQWNVNLDAVAGRVDLDVLLLAWLDEVLYQAQAKSRWMLSAEVKITQQDDHSSVSAMVSYVDGGGMNRGVEVKAVSSHGLVLKHLDAGESLPGRGDAMPTLVGPAWYADVLLDV